MANSPYDDSDDPLRSPKFNRAIRQAEEKGIRYGFDFEGFYKRREEPVRKVGWDCQSERADSNNSGNLDLLSWNAWHECEQRLVTNFNQNSEDNNCDSSKEYSDRYYDGDIIDDSSALPFNLTAEEYADYLEQDDYIFDGKGYEFV